MTSQEAQILEDYAQRVRRRVREITRLEIPDAPHQPYARGGRIEKLPASHTKLLPIAPAQISGHIRRMFPDITDSDHFCLMQLVEQGKLEFLLDRHTRKVAVFPDPAVEHLFESIAAEYTLDAPK